MENQKIVVWFGAGAASAVAAKKTIELYGKKNEITIINSPILEEHEDNRRFVKDVEEWIQHPIIEARNKDFPNASIMEVFKKRRYISGIEGAPCTRILKKEARYQYEAEHNIDWHVLGFTIDEYHRQKRFNLNEKENTLSVLISLLIEKADCFNILKKAGIKRPIVYELGLPNANCLGCVKATSPTYWNLIRKIAPDKFLALSILSRELGVRLVRVKGKRIFLDELKETDKGAPIKSWDCGVFCDMGATRPTNTKTLKNINSV